MTLISAKIVPIFPRIWHVATSGGKSIKSVREIMDVQKETELFETILGRDFPDCNDIRKVNSVALRPEFVKNRYAQIIIAVLALRGNKRLGICQDVRKSVQTLLSFAEYALDRHETGSFAQVVSFCAK